MERTHDDPAPGLTRHPLLTAVAALGSVPETPRQTVETSEEARERVATARGNRVRLYTALRPSRFVAATLDVLRPPQQPFAAALTGWWSGGSRNLLMTGNAGLGKSHVGWAICNEAIADDVMVQAWTVSRLVAALRPNNRVPDLPGLILTRVCTARLLFLDDLGREAVTDWVGEQVQTILDVRSGEPETRTIVATNLSSDAVEARYGAPVLDRLIDEATVMRFAGTSMRQPAAF